MQERNQLLPSLVRCASAIDPTNMAMESQACIIKFDALVDRLHQHSCLNDSEGDEAKSDFRDFLQDVVRSKKDEFTQHDFPTTRLGNFLSGYVSHSKKYQHLWKVITFIFGLSLGQSAIERGFNVNNEVLREILEKMTLTCMCLIYDQITTTKLKVHEIPQKLIISCNDPSNRYKSSLDENTKTTEKKEVRQK